MANTVLTNDIIAQAAVRLFENNCVAAKKVSRSYEAEFSNNTNGYSRGDTVPIRKYADFTVTDGAVMTPQDVIEGQTSLVVNQQKNVGFQFNSIDRTLKIGDFADRILKPIMIQLGNKVDSDLMSLYSSVPNWVGTPGEVIDSFTDFAKVPERMTELGVPAGNRCAALNPADYWGLVGSQTGLLQANLVSQAYNKGNLPEVAGIMPYETQNAPTHTNGNFAGTVLVDLSITAATTTYDAVKNTNTQTIHLDGFTAATAALKKGDVFTIDGVYAVNSVTKDKLPFLKQFTLTADATAAGNEVDVVVTPALIWSGAQQTVHVEGVSDLNNQAVTFMGTANTAYRQSLAFHKDAFTLAMVPMRMPDAAYNGTRQSYKGMSIRMIPIYDGTNDVESWRLDILYGFKAVDPRLAVRVSGT